MGWATFGAIVPQTHLVALFTQSGQKKKNCIFSGFLANLDLPQFFFS
jgi:hypothetical protein